MGGGWCCWAHRHLPSPAQASRLQGGTSAQHLDTQAPRLWPPCSPAEGPGRQDAQEWTPGGLWASEGAFPVGLMGTLPTQTAR